MYQKRWIDLQIKEPKLDFTAFVQGFTKEDFWYSIMLLSLFAALLFGMFTRANAVDRLVKTQNFSISAHTSLNPQLSAQSSLIQ